MERKMINMNNPPQADILFQVIVDIWFFSMKSSVNYLFKKGMQLKCQTATHVVKANILLNYDILCQFYSLYILGLFFCPNILDYHRVGLRRIEIADEIFDHLPVKPFVEMVSPLWNVDSFNTAFLFQIYTLSKGLFRCEAVKHCVFYNV